jgi:hypothetical protein
MTDVAARVRQQPTAPLPHGRRLAPVCAALLLVCVVPLAGCNRTNPQVQQLDAAEAAWNRAPPASYAFTLKYSAFIKVADCEAMAFEVRVEQGVVAAAADCPSLRAEFAGVPRLFRFVRDTLAKRPHRLQVRYDAVLGYPVHVAVDPDADVADIQYAVDVSDFRVTQPGVGAHGQPERE